MQEFKKIRLFKDFTTSFSSGKLIFSAPRFQNNHLTLHLGENSGILDFHLTKNSSNIHYTLFKISHAELLKILPSLMIQLTTALLGNPNEITNDFLKQNGYKIFSFSDPVLDDDELKKLKKRKALDLDPDSNPFQEFQQKLGEDFEMKEVKIEDLEKVENFNGYISNDDSSTFVMKSNLTNYKLISFEKFNLDLKTILINAFGNEGFETIDSKITNGIKHLNENSESHFDDWITLTTK